MATPDIIFSPNTWIGAGATIAILLGWKIIDIILEKLIGKRIISPIISKTFLSIRSYLTLFEPINATFQMSHSIEEDLNVIEAKTELESVFTKLEDETGERVSGSEIKWNDRDGHLTLQHIDVAQPYDVELVLQLDHEDKFNPDVRSDQSQVAEVNLQIQFEFSVPNIDSELANVGLVASRLEGVLSDKFRGIGSEARIILHPIQGDLSLDEWIEKEGMDVSVLLASPNDDVRRTEVEFFPDHVEVHPPYYEVDSETSRIVRLLVQNYYLKSRSTLNIIKLSG